MRYKIKLSSRVSEQLKKYSDFVQVAPATIVAEAVTQWADGTRAQEYWGLRRYAAFLSYLMNKYNIKPEELEEACKESTKGLGPSPKMELQAAGVLNVKARVVATPDEAHP